MPDKPSETPAGYWTAFGLQNHVVPTEDGRAKPGKVIGLCGVIGEVAATSAPDRRPTCSVCSAKVKDGTYRITKPPI